jgi:YgiT-type zinc finger domain-containing protein
MKCAICRNGTTEEGYTTVVLEREQMTLVFKSIPAQICNNCGEEYISKAVNQTVLSRANEELNKGVMLEMLQFAA